MPIIGQRDQLLPQVIATAKKYRIDPALLDAIIVTESTYNPWQIRYEPTFVSNVIPNGFARKNDITIDTEAQLQKFSFGLCQIMGGVARGMGFGGLLTNLLEPGINLALGANLIANLTKRFPLLDDAIAAYNAGRPNLDADGRYRNQEYVDKVTQTMTRLKAS